MTDVDTPVRPLDEQDIGDVLTRARELGFEGFGGACGEAAIVINRVLFDGKGTLVGVFNETFLGHGRMIGHVVVLYDGNYWDADAYPKELSDIDHWGMLNPDNEDYALEAERLGFTWNEDTASSVAIMDFEDEIEILLRFGVRRLKPLTEILRQACQEHERVSSLSLLA